MACHAMKPSIERINVYTRCTRRTRSVQRGRFRSLETWSALFPDHYSILEGALFIVLIKTTFFIFQYFEFDHLRH